MNYLEQFQTLSKEEATKAIFDVLNKKALESLDESFKGKLEDFADRAGTTQVNAADKVHDIVTKVASTVKAGIKFVTNKVKSVKEESELTEGVRKVGDYSAGRHKATIHKDSDLSEYKVKFYEDGKHHEPADYFTDDKEDATDTAKMQCDRNHAKDTK